MIEVEGDGIDRNYRTHTSQLFSGVWVASVMHLGAKGPLAETVPGDYRTHEEAVEAAKRHSEQEEEKQRQKEVAPASVAPAGGSGGRRTRP